MTLLDRGRGWLGATFRTDVCWQSLDLQDTRACAGEATTPTNSPRQQATNMARMRKLHLGLGVEVLSQGLRAEIRPGASDCCHQVCWSAISVILWDVRFRVQKRRHQNYPRILDTPHPVRIGRLRR